MDVPSASNVLRCATVPLRILEIHPAEGEIGPGAIYAVLATVPLDRAKLAGVTLKDGATELPVRRALSLDGRTLAVTPQQALPSGRTFTLTVAGLASLVGETAPTLTRTYRTPAVPEPPVAVDFSRIELGYPDANYNLTVTIPAGAVPPGAGVALEGLLSTHSGSMHPTGPLTVSFKALRGERIRVTVLLATGKEVVGYVSRYVSPEGKVTIGVDGGLVTSADGKAAAILPPGALDVPTEVMVSVLPGLPEELDPALAKFPEKVAGRIQIQADREVQLKKRPILKLAAPANPSTAAHSDGLGAYGIFDRVEGFEADGTPVVYFELSDTASVNGPELVSQGGLPEPSPVADGGMANPFLGSFAHRDGLSSRILNREMGPGRAVTRTAGLSAPVSMGPGGPGMEMRGGLLDGIWYTLLAAWYLDSGPHYVAGNVKIQYPGEAAEKPCGGAYVHFGKSPSVSRGGQILSRTCGAGSYILASFLTSELVRGGGFVTAVDPDYGVSGTSGSVFHGPGGIWGSYHRGQTIRLVVTPQTMQDRVAPYVEMGFEVREASGRLVARDFAKPGEELVLRVATRDNAMNMLDMQNVGMDIEVDAAKLPGCTGSCGSRPWAANAEMVHITEERGLAVYRFRLKDLAEGRHRVAVSVWDASCNQRSVTGEVVVASFPVCSDPMGQVPPEATLEVGGDPSNVSPGVLPKLRFSQSMRMLGMADLKLEKKVNGAWEAVPGKVLGPKGDLTRFPVDSLCQVILRPAGLLQAGQTYRVVWTAALRNTVDLPLVAGSCEFTISNVTAGPTFAEGGWWVTHTVTLGQRVFAVLRQPGTDVWSLGEFEIRGDRMARIGDRFGPFNGTFRLQGVNAMAVFEHVPVPGGEPEHLLLVTTSPQIGRQDLNGVLWAYRVCGGADGSAVPELRFAVSLGPGSNGYAPTVDQVNGLIVVPRLVGSNLLIRVEKAINGWSSNLAGAALNPMGANLGAILQPFYLANPVDTSSVINMPMSPGTSWAAALLPTVPGSGSATVDVLMGYSQLSWEGSPYQSGAALRGMPVWRKAYDGDKWKAEPPYVGPDGYGTASIRALKGPATVLAAGTRVAVVPGIRVTVEGQEYETNLALGTVNGPVAGTSGRTHVAIVDERDPANPVHLADWPTTDILGPGVPFQVRRKAPSVDPKTKLVGVCVTPLDAQGPYTWFILDLKAPKTPQVVAKIENAGYSGSLWDGQFVTNTNNGIAVHYLPEVLEQQIMANIDPEEAEKLFVGPMMPDSDFAKEQKSKVESLIARAKVEVEVLRAGVCGDQPPSPPTNAKKGYLFR